MRFWGDRSLGIVLVLLVAIQLRVLVQLRGPPVTPGTAPAEQFSAERAVAVLERLLGDQVAHPAGSTANDRVRERLVAQLETLGLEVELQRCQPASSRGLRLANVLARLPRCRNTAARPLVLATHYDSVAAGPGAADAGACVAALIETARILRQKGSWPRPVYFLFTDGEEQGMLGAREFVANHPLALRKPMVMNFEARGTSGPSLMFETHRGNLAVVRILADHLPQPCVSGSSFVTVYRHLPNDTDFTIFQREGWIGFNFAFIQDAHHYHTAQDTIENLSLHSLQHHGENALALSRAIAGNAALSLDSANQDAVFFDVLGFDLIAFPQSWAFPLAAVPLVVLLWRFPRRQGIGSILFASLSVGGIVVLALLLSGAIGFIATAVLIAAGVLPRSHLPYDTWVWVSYLPVSLVLVWGLGHYFLSRIAESMLWFAWWVEWALVGVAVAIGLPGFSYLLLVPAWAAAVAALLPLSVRSCTVVAGVSAAVLWVPLANLLPVSLGARSAVLFHPTFTLVWLPFLPLLGLSQEKGKKPEAETGHSADTP
jgi:hypothetical protein